MIRKIIAIILIVAFFNMVAASAFADSDAEKDRDQQRAVLAAIGLVCLVGCIYMLSKMGKDDFAESYYSSVLEKKPTKNGFKIGLDFYDSNNLKGRVPRACPWVSTFDKQGSAKNQELGTPALTLRYSW